MSTSVIDFAGADASSFCSWQRDTVFCSDVYVGVTLPKRSCSDSAVLPDPIGPKSSTLSPDALLPLPKKIK